jgi:hypothetical protein
MEMLSGAFLLVGVVVGLRFLPFPNARRLIHVSIRVRVAPRGNTAAFAPVVTKANDPRRLREPRKRRATGTQLGLLRSVTAIAPASGGRWG